MKSKFITIFILIIISIVFIGGFFNKSEAQNGVCQHVGQKKIEHCDFDKSFYKIYECDKSLNWRLVRDYCLCEGDLCNKILFCDPSVNFLRLNSSFCISGMAKEQECRWGRWRTVSPCQPIIPKDCSSGDSKYCTGNFESLTGVQYCGEEWGNYETSECQTGWFDPLNGDNTDLMSIHLIDISSINQVKVGSLGIGGSDFLIDSYGSGFLVRGSDSQLYLSSEGNLGLNTLSPRSMLDLGEGDIKVATFDNDSRPECSDQNRGEMIFNTDGQDIQICSSLGSWREISDNSAVHTCDNGEMEPWEECYYEDVEYRDGGICMEKEKRECLSNCTWGDWSEPRFKDGNECIVDGDCPGGMVCDGCVCSYCGNEVVDEDQGEECEIGGYETNFSECDSFCLSRKRTCDDDCTWNDWGSCDQNHQCNADEDCQSVCGIWGYYCGQSCTCECIFPDYSWINEIDWSIIY